MTKAPEHHISKDGSSTLYSSQFGQFYHNPNGAVSESKHIFFETSGLIKALEPDTESLTIFEVGFGTGLNFFLLIDQYLSKKLSFPIHFYSVEAFPIDSDTAKLFNFENFLASDLVRESVSKVFSGLKPGMNTITPVEGEDINLHLFYGPFEELDSIEHKADFIFHDPFSPEVNKELWTVDTFAKLKSFSITDTVLATYCAASKARASMAAAGWFISKAPGALGKREMTLASLNAEKLSSFKRVNEQRLIERLNEGAFFTDS
ncbi:MAG: tRNA (5-methylaminomethyl-2-thiouridine)(34)-methyltransferase MnmD [Balneolaceae bacterium]